MCLKIELNHFTHRQIFFICNVDENSINGGNEHSKKVEALKVGPGMDKNSEMGPLVTKEHLDLSLIHI